METHNETTMKLRFLTMLTGLVVAALSGPFVEKPRSVIHAVETTPATISSGNDALASYAAEIAPIVERTCVKCHGEREQKGGIRFDELDPAMSFDHQGLRT